MIHLIPGFYFHYFMYPEGIKYLHLQFFIKFLYLGFVSFWLDTWILLKFAKQISFMWLWSSNKWTE